MINKYFPSSVSQSLDANETDDKAYSKPDEILELEGNIFRGVFKFYKRRIPLPDLSQVLDLRISCSELGIKCEPISPFLIKQFESSVNEINGLRPLNQWTITTIGHRRGLYILNDIFDQNSQIRWITNALLKYSLPPNITNIPTHEGGTVLLSQIRKSLRWATLGNDYDWNVKEYSKNPRNALPPELVEISKLVVNILGLNDLSPDAAIINYYPEKASMSPHVDRSERDHSRPLVSLSFGQSAIYLTGGKTLQDSVDALILHSGDVLVMDGEQRLVYHAVPRILSTKKFHLSDIDFKEFSESDLSFAMDYANHCRINFTIRQVD